MCSIKHKEKSDVVQALDVQRLIAQSQIQVLLGKLEQLVRLNDGAQLVGLLLAANEAGIAHVGLFELLAIVLIPTKHVVETCRARSSHLQQNGLCGW